MPPGPDVSARERAAGYGAPSRSVVPALVSVVTPCWNSGPFVRETIESVLAQSYAFVEHIVVDDASTDESWDVIRSYGGRYGDRLRGVRLDANRGASHARNHGAALGAGEFLMFLDADDVLAPDTLAALVDALRDRADAVAACPWHELTRQADGTWRERAPTMPPLDGDASLLGRWISGEQWIPPCALLWRRDVFERVGGWDEALTANDDGDLMQRAFIGGVRVVETAHGRAYYRRHGDARVSLSRAAFSEGWFRSKMRVLAKVEHQLAAIGRSSAYTRERGVAYQELALIALQRGQPAIARECLELGEALAGRVPLAPTPIGRALTSTLGMERKERLASWLAARGLMTVMRRRQASFYERHRRDARTAVANSPEASPDRTSRSRHSAARSNDSPPGARTRVTVAVVTCKRPEGLAGLLEALRHLRFAASPTPVLELLVIDNDALGSAASICDAARSTLGWPLRYVVEPRRGIAQARNAAVRHAAGDADFVAFIDDDEVPEPFWLDELLRVQCAHGADVVAGPVMPRFAGPVAPWIAEGGFFTLPRYATGARLDRAYTGNVLVRAALLRSREQAFDERLGLSGGEDVHLFLQLAAEGRLMVWADEAHVHEWVPPSRATARWLIQRAYRTGNIWAVCDRSLSAPPVRRALRVLRSLGRVGKGALLLPFAALRGPAAATRAARTLALGAGYLAGASGHRYEEYRTIHGS